MVDEVVGRGIIEVVGDSSQLTASMAQGTQAIEKFEDAAVNSAKNVGSAFSQTAAPVTAATDKIDAATRRYIASVEREIAATSLSRAEYRRWEAQVKGIPESVYAPLNKRLEEAKKAQEAATAAARASQSTYVQTAKVYNEYGQTVKQTNAALRQVPAQITDIVVSLQGGTAPLTVLLQQGGQLRDVFGGIVPAAKALGNAVLNLINPYTLLAAAGVALIAAYAKGSSEADAYRKAISETGNIAGTSIGQLNEYARSISQVVGNQAQAAAALTAFVATGRVANENLERFARTAIETQRATGKAVADTVKEYAELGKEPVEASRRLNDSMNYLTLSVYQQIKALEEVGKKTDAARLAQEAYDRELSRRSAGIVENIGLFEAAWRRVRDATLGAISAAAGVGRPETSVDRVNRLQQQLKVSEGYGPGEFNRQSQERLRKELKDAQQDVTDATVRANNRGLIARSQAAAIEAEGEISRIRKESATNTQKLNKELDAYRRNLDKIRQVSPNNPLLDPAAITRDEANIRERFKEKGGAKPRAFTDDAATRRLQQLRETEASLRLELSTTEKLVGAQRDLAEFNQLIADLKEKRILTAEQKSLLAAQDQIRAQLNTNVALQQRLKLRDEEQKKIEQQAEAVRKLEERSAQIQASADAANARRREQYDDRLAVFGKGSEAREQLASQIAISREFARFEDQLRKGTKPELYDSDLYKKAQADIKASLEQAQADNARYYEAIKRNQGDWQNGSLEALQNYVDNAANISSKLEDVFTKAFKGAEDALLQFARTGKLDFKSLADSIISDLVRIAIQQQITKPLAEGLMSGMTSGSGFGGLVGSALGAFFGSGMNIDTGGIGITSAGSSLASMGLGGGRAIGGPVSPGRAYEVGENGPELLNWQGRQFLLPGNGMGNVEAKPQGAAPPMAVTNQFYISGPVDRRTQTQLAAEAGRGVQRALARNN